MSTKTVRRLLFVSIPALVLLVLVLLAVPVYQSLKERGRFPILHEPDLKEDFGLDVNLDRFSPGYVEPPLPEPGETLTLTVGHTRQDAVGGFWHPVSLSVVPLPHVLPDKSIFEWKPSQQDVLGVHSVWGNTIKLDPYRARVLGTDESPLLQISFDLPAADALRGEELRVDVDLKVAYPVRVPADVQFLRFRNVEEDIRKIFSIKVASPQEAACYEEWERARSRWKDKGWW